MGGEDSISPPPPPIFFYENNIESNKIIGCCYIYPSANTQYEVQVFFWIKENLLREGLEPELGITIKSWLEESWPFRAFDFPGRNI